MGCVYCDFEDRCNLWDGEFHKDNNYKNSEYGFSKENKGYCAVNYDPNPEDNCSMYENNEEQNDI